MKKIVKTSFIIILLFFSNQFLLAEVPHFLDFKYILNESDAGKKLNPFLKKARGG